MNNTTMSELVTKLVEKKKGKQVVAPKAPPAPKPAPLTLKSNVSPLWERLQSCPGITPATLSSLFKFAQSRPDAVAVRKEALKWGIVL